MKAKLAARTNDHREKFMLPAFRVGDLALARAFAMPERKACEIGISGEQHASPSRQTLRR